MTTLEEIISATCITEVLEVVELSNYDLDGKDFRLFLMPKTKESEVKVGDVVKVNGRLPYTDDDTDVPIVVGKWSPILFNFIKSCEEADVTAFVAPFRNYKA